MINFTLEESKTTPTTVTTIYGDKGVGKTWFSLTYPEPIYVLSYDHKTDRIKGMFTDKEIHVYDAVKYLKHNENDYLPSAVTTLSYIRFILTELAKLKPKPATIVHDGLQILQEIAEMNMRAKHKLKPFQGIANLNVWKDRRLILRDIHEMTMNAVREGGHHLRKKRRNNTGRTGS